MRRIKYLKNKLALTALYIAVLLLFWTFGIPCLYKHLLGFCCPGCGMSRAYFSLLRLDFVAAFNYHPMFWSVPIAYLYFLFDGRLFGKKILDYTVMILIVLGFIINWIANLW
ncbi:MAG: DUF2752 domain-containing protein [Clostridia bacterium]|nr:DUF2752 domain-containing protein [Clostridia bacterium]